VLVVLFALITTLLVMGMFLSKPRARVVIIFRSETSIRPIHLLGRNRDHDSYFELRGEDEQNAPIS